MKKHIGLLFLRAMTLPWSATPARELSAKPPTWHDLATQTSASSRQGSDRHYRGYHFTRRIRVGSDYAYFEPSRGLKLDASKRFHASGIQVALE